MRTPSPCEARVRRPDILWIVTTQWRAQATGYSGDVNAHTPHLDALAAESVVFTQAITPHPFGPFARAALITGVPSPENGVRTYFDSLPRNAQTIAHLLREKGYETAFFGKWHLSKRDPQMPLVGEAHAKLIIPEQDRGGFEFWEGFESGFLLNEPWLHGTRLPSPTRFQGYQSDVVCRRAADWLRDRRSRTRFDSPGIDEMRPISGARPCFCVVSLEAPHPPYDAPSFESNITKPESIVLPSNVPRGGTIEEKARRELSGYYSHIGATDTSIGELLKVIDPRDTLIAFTSVHGDMHGAHGLFRKGWPYEESIRVPLLIRVPKSKGRLDPSAISLIDLPALTLNYSVNRELKAPKKEYAYISMPSVVLLPHQCHRVWQGVRTSRYKLVLKGDGSPWLFFDLQQDPNERSNLADDQGRLVEMIDLAKRCNLSAFRAVP